jgi:hypothetical protein
VIFLVIGAMMGLTLVSTGMWTIAETLTSELKAGWKENIYHRPVDLKLGDTLFRGQFENKHLNQSLMI